MKCVLSLKNISFKKFLSIARCSSPHFTCLQHCKWLAGFCCCVCWTYMIVAVDRNAKYVIMCLKKVLISDNDKDRHIRVFGNTFTYNSDIFSGTMMHRPFNIYNQTRLFKFFRYFANFLPSWTIM